MQEKETSINDESTPPPPEATVGQSEPDSKSEEDKALLEGAEAKSKVQLDWRTDLHRYQGLKFTWTKSEAVRSVVNGSV